MHGFNISSRGTRTRIQLIGLDFDNQSVGVYQWIQSASCTGLESKDFTSYEPPDVEGPYSFNAIFDTGTNTFVSSVRSIFCDLVKLVTPVGVDANGHRFLATHSGNVTLYLGGQQVKIDYAL